jgi:putative transposase
MVELGYELPDLDELLLYASQNPNLHRDRLRDQFERDDFGFDRR